MGLVSKHNAKGTVIFAKSCGIQGENSTKSAKTANWKAYQCVLRLRMAAFMMSGMPTRTMGFRTQTCQLDPTAGWLEKSSMKVSSVPAMPVASSSRMSHSQKMCFVHVSVPPFSKLEVQELKKSFGEKEVLHGISFHVESGSALGLLGRNGAGKTTTLQTITGMLKPEKGEVIFNGVDISKIPGHKIVPMGMAHVPEGRRVFAQLSVYENLKMGAYTRKDKNEIEESLKMVYKRFPRLEERKNQLAGTLSGGEQQMLAMGRALMSKPKIILMDEPSMGLSPIFVNEIFDIIKSVSESGTTVLLVEQNAKKALSIADRAYVLETGTVSMEGNADDLLHDEAVQKAYLGE
mgnify:CR=1 FL=1